MPHYYYEPKINEADAEINIFYFLHQQNNIKGWIDVENELAFLASRKVHKNFRLIMKKNFQHWFLNKKKRLSNNLDLPSVIT